MAKFTRANSIRAKAASRFARTTDPRRGLPVAENALGRGFAPAGPNRKWCADFTHASTPEGWLFLAVVADPFSRRVVGWAVSAATTGRLAAHSDRGSQHAGEHHLRCRARGG